MAEAPKSKKYYSFNQKVWRVGLVLVLLLSLLFLFKETVHIFVLILVGSLIACYFRGISNFIQKKTKWSAKLSLATSILGTLVITGGVFYLMGATIVSQTTELQEAFPELIEKAEDFIAETEVGKELSAQVDNIKDSDELGEFLSDFFKTSFGGIGDIYVILLVGLYFMADPKIYKNGILQLVPPQRRKQANKLLEEIATDLTKWLFGKFFSMALVFVLTAIALAIVGIPMWLALAFIAGLFVFIPNFGPIIAAIPALLVALSQSTGMFITVGIIYLVIQISEGSFITPKVQQRLIAIPPALIILGQIFGGTLIGVWGVVFATPIVLILLILVKELYVRPMNRRNSATTSRK